MKKLLRFGQHHITRWGVGAHYDWLQINIVVVATYIIMVKASFLLCCMGKLVREGGSTSLDMTGRIRKRNRRKVEKVKCPQINFKGFKNKAETNGLGNKLIPIIAGIWKKNNRHLANLRKERKQYWKQRQHITDMRVFENQKWFSVKLH